MSASKNFVLTGVTGFIGSEVLLRLLAHPELRIICLVRRPIDFDQGLLGERFKAHRDQLKRVEFVVCRFDSELLFQAALRQIDVQNPVIVHMAALIALSSKGTRSFSELEVEQNRANIGVTQDLLNFCKERSGSLVYTSSVVAFGATRVPKIRRESDFANFDSICKSFSYYRTKREAHEFVIGQSGSVPVRVLCPGIVHGALDGFKDSRAHLKMLIQGKIGLVPYGTGNFVGLDRVAAAHVDAALELARGGAGAQTRLLVDENLSFFNYLKLYLEVYHEVRPTAQLPRLPRALWPIVSQVLLLVIVLLAKLGLRGELGLKVAQASMHLAFESQYPQPPTRGLRAALIDSISTQSN
jgi:nucleoside-diphosphate-sugar epimerase